LDILKGFGDTLLDRVVSVFTEVSTDTYYQDGCTYEEIDNYLHGYGYFKVEEIFEWERERNVIYINKNQI